MNDDEIIETLLRSGLDDWVMLHDVVWESTHGAVTEPGKATVLRILDRLYREALMVPGELGETGFDDWSTPKEMWVERSRSELERLQWTPMGEGFWLRLTESGERQVLQKL